MSSELDIITSVVSVALSSYKDVEFTARHYAEILYKGARLATYTEHGRGFDDPDGYDKDPILPSHLEVRAAGRPILRLVYVGGPGHCIMAEMINIPVIVKFWEFAGHIIYTIKYDAMREIHGIHGRRFELHVTQVDPRAELQASSQAGLQAPPQASPQAPKYLIEVHNGSLQQYTFDSKPEALKKVRQLFIDELSRTQPYCAGRL